MSAGWPGPTMRIGDRIVGPSGPAYVIAEIGVNHEGSLEVAKRLVESAARGGADAAKFQTYKAALLASRNSPSYWDTTKEPTTSQYELFTKYDGFGPDEYAALAAHCRSVGIHFMSTPFDLGAVEMLEPLVPAFKVASADLTNEPLLARVARTGKPVLLSTGAASLEEVEDALAILRGGGAGPVCLLHCILNYPTADEHAHLGMLLGMARRWPEVVLGSSDHTVPSEHMDSLVAARLLGAVVLEKHFTHDTTLPGNDHYHAMDEAGLACYRRREAQMLRLLGPTTHKGWIPSEEPARRNARRSLVLVRDLPAGHRLREEDLVAKRPGTGVSPMLWREIVGTTLVRALPEDHILTWDDVRRP